VCHDLLLDKSNGANNSTAAFASSVRGKMPGLRMRWSKGLGFHLEGVRTIPVVGTSRLFARESTHNYMLRSWRNESAQNTYKVTQKYRI
jgi:hypothetical protein